MRKPNLWHITLILLVMIIAVQPFALAASILDKSFDSETETVTLSYLGTDMVTLRLDYNTPFCIGKDACKGRLEIIPLYDIDTDLLGKFDKQFKDKDNKDKAIENKWEWFYYVEEQYLGDVDDYGNCTGQREVFSNLTNEYIIENYSYSCKVGSHKEYLTRQSREYKEIGKGTLFAGSTYYAEIVGSLYEGAVDWQVIFADLLIDEFAWWDSSTPELYERYNINDDGSGWFGDDGPGEWFAQTFTIGVNGTNEAFDVAYVRIKLGATAAGTSGPLAIGIKAVDGDNKPTGVDLANGTIADANIPVNDWVGVNMTAAYTLQPDTQYALVFRLLNSGVSDYRQIRYDYTDPTYGGGNGSSTLSSGATWTIKTWDYMFEIWGVEEAVPVGDVFINANWTTPARSNLSNYTLKATGNTSSYNVSVELLNETVSYLKYILIDLANDTLFKNSTTVPHAGEDWTLTVNTTQLTTIGYNTTNITTSYTAPNLPADISPTPANGSTITTLTPIINISVTDIDGNGSLNCNYFLGTSLSTVVYNTTLKTNIDGICNWTTPMLADATTYYWNATVGDGHFNSSVTPLKNFIISIGNVFVNLNFTDLPYYTNSTMNVSFRIIRNQSSYNATYNISNGSVQYLLHTVVDLANNTMFSNKSVTVAHAEEIWNVIVNTTASTSYGYNTSSVTIACTCPELPVDIPPSPTNNTWITDTTPTFNISVDDIDGNSSLNCHFYLGVTTTPTYNATMQTKNGICNWTAPTLGENINYYWKVRVDDSNSNSSFNGLQNFSVDATAPIISNFIPINSSYTNTQFPVVIVNITDTISGVNNYSIDLFVQVNTGTPVNRTSLASKTNVANGIQVKYTHTDPLGNADVIYANISARDVAGNYKMVQWHYTIDIVNPSVTLKTPADSATISINSENFTGRGTDAISNLSNVTLVIWESGAFNYSRSMIIDVISEANNTNITTMNYTFLNDGTYEWNYYYCDNATSGGTSPNCAYATNNRTITVWVKPVVDVPAFNPVTLYSNSTINCSINITDLTGGSLIAEFKLYNGSTLFYKQNITTSNGDFVSINNTGEQQVGEIWNCSVTPWDLTGSGIMQSKDRTVVNIPPIVSLTSPANRTNTTDNTYPFVFNYTDADLTTGSCVLYVNGTNVGSDSSVTSGIDKTITSSALNDGLQQQWYINCTDGTDVVTSEIRIIGIDATIPIIDIDLPTGEYFTQGLPYYNLPVNFSYVEENSDTCWYNLDNLIPSRSNIIQQNPNQTGCVGSFDDPCANGYDNDWSTYARSDGGLAYIFENYTIPLVNSELPNTTTITSKFWGDALDPPTLSCWNYSVNSWYEIAYFLDDHAGVYSYTVLSGCMNGTILQIKSKLPISGVLYYEGKINWYSKYTGGNITLSNCANSSLNVSSSGNHIVYVYQNDTFNNIGSSSSSFSINLYNVSHSVSEGNITEGQSVTFNLQINSINITSTNATLYYNNTPYGYSTLSNSSHQANFTRTITIPLSITSGYEYYWNYSINSFTNLTDKRNLTISQMIIALCGDGYDTVALNFTSLDEENSSYVRSDFKVTFTIWASTESVSRDYSFISLNSSNHTFCISPAYAILNLSMNAEYLQAEDKTVYVQRSYYLRYANITNQTNSIDIFMLTSSRATSVIIKILDEFQSPIDEALLKVLRYYPGEGVYKTVEIAKTSEDGLTIIKIVEEDADYKFLIENSAGRLLKITTPAKIVCLASPCTLDIPTGEIESVLSGIIVKQRISYTTTFNNNTGYAIFTYSDPTGVTLSMRMHTIKLTGYGESSICDTTLSSSAGTITCYVGNLTGEYVLRIYREASPDTPFATYSFGISEIWRTFGIEALLWVLFFLIAMFFVGLVIDKVAAIALTLGGFIVIFMFGIINLPYYLLISVIVVGVIIIVKMRT